MFQYTMTEYEPLTAISTRRKLRRAIVDRDEARAWAVRMYRRALDAEAALAAMDRRCAELEERLFETETQRDIWKAFARNKEQP